MNSHQREKPERPEHRGGQRPAPERTPGTSNPSEAAEAAHAADRSGTPEPAEAAEPVTTSLTAPSSGPAVPSGPATPSGPGGRRRTLAATGAIGTAVALSLTAALVLPTAGATPPGSGAPGAAAAVPASADDRRVTLITGDQVLLAGTGEVIGLIPAEGREDVPYSVHRSGDNRYVIPLDAQPAVEEGLVDRRLFDVTELSRPAYDAAAGPDGVPVIVTYDAGSDADTGASATGAAATDGPDARLFRQGGEAEVRAELESVNGQALTLDPEAAAATWRSLTGGDRTRAAGAVSAEAVGSALDSAGVTAIWLDGVHEASLDVSVPQVGAPSAWEAGYDGEGVTIAVLDTGIDETHPDLAGGKVIAEANFSHSPDAEDRDGHGTHVASIAAGTGAASDGAYTGVAPGARLLSGKVLDDEGSGFHSDIIEGMEWAAEQGADIVNLSLGGSDAPGVDPVEEAVNRLSADGGPLFVAAAGNEGWFGPGTVGSPASADAALAVGAVDDADELADFSSRGPRVGDGAVKPELTAPGVSIGAAAAEGSRVAERGEPVAEGYAGLSGTSMASPHVAGAAALLAQRHPEWSGRQLRAALIASTEPGAAYGPFEQGTGRLDVAAAMAQTVVAEPATLAFGSAEWPHEESDPISRELTYRNLGEDDVTLDLAVTGRDPEGGAAPEGMFTVDASSVTVPAGGTAAVTVTADPALAAAGVLGAYGTYVTATADGSADAGGQTVRTAGAVELPGETYELTVEAAGQDGAAGSYWGLSAMDHRTGEFRDIAGPEGEPVRSARLPAGDWLVYSSYQRVDADGTLTEVVVQAQPLVELTEDTTVTFDAREARPVAPTVADEEAALSRLAAELQVGPGSAGITIGSPHRIGLRTQHVGPRLPDEAARTRLLGSWRNATAAEYHALKEAPGGYVTGDAEEYGLSDFAEATVDLGAVGDGVEGQLIVHNGDLGAYGPLVEFPSTASVRLTPGGWSFETFFFGDVENGGFGTVPQTYEAGERYRHRFNVGVFGPTLAEGTGVHRYGDTLYVHNHLGDGWSDHGSISVPSGEMTLRRDGEVIGTADWYDEHHFAVEPGEAAYELTATARLDGPVSTEVTSTHTFTSASVAEDDFVPLPVSAVRFSPDLALDSTAVAGERMAMPVSVTGAAAGNLARLTVSVSLDGGETWRKAPVRRGVLTVTNPPAGGTVSLRAEVRDRDGNTTEQTVIDAYRTVSGDAG